MFSCKVVQSYAQKITRAKSDFISLEESVSSKIQWLGLWKAQNTIYTLRPRLDVAISDCWHLLTLADFLVLKQIEMSKWINHLDEKPYFPCPLNLKPFQIFSSSCKHLPNSFWVACWQAALQVTEISKDSCLSPCRSKDRDCICQLGIRS